MFDLGIQELIVIFIVVLLVFGPKKLPELSKSLGKGIASLKKAMREAKTEIDSETHGPIQDIKNEVSALPSWKDQIEKDDKGQSGPETEH